MNESLPPLRRLIALAVLLPAAVAASNSFLLAAAPAPWLRWGYYPWMAASVAILSWSSGRYLRPVWLSWIVFAWSIVLLDFLTIAACNGPLERETGFVLVSAQISLVILWAILGPGHWQMRVPAAIATAPMISFLSESLGSTWPIQWGNVLLLAAGVMTALCCGLRYIGFVSEKVDEITTAATDSGKKTVIQFGVKHMLIWLTVTGPLVLVIRSIRWGNDTNFLIVLLAVSVATLNLISIWAVLGGGPALLRVACLVAAPLGIAWGFNAYSAFLNSANISRPFIFSLPVVAQAMIHMHGRWFGWFWLAAALLAALLLFLRAQGYQLMRTGVRPRTSTAAET